MRKILKILLYSLLVLLAGLIIVSYISYNTYSPGDKGIEVSVADLTFYRDSYEECRSDFRLKVDELKDRFDMITYMVSVESKTDTNLTIDICYIPPSKDTSKLLVISSGVHGVEGFTGSAIQQMFLTELLSPELLEEMGILIIHSVNPYGFKNLRRVTENNVDLNRNSDTEISLYANENPGYVDIYDLLNPAGKVNTGSLSNQFFYAKAIANIIRASMATLRQAVLQGQYDFPEGLYYGGNDFEPQIRSLQSILPPIFEPYEAIFEIDLHTGYGERRVLHLFPNPVEDQKIKQLTQSIFEGQPIDWGDSDDFYTITGDFSYFLGKIKPDVLYLNMPFEFGTLDSQKTFGSLKSVQNMILENQGAHWGYKREKDEKKVKETFLEMYYPSSEAWRSEVMKQARDMLELVIDNYQSLDLE